MNAEQTKDDFLLQSSSNLRQKIVTWSGDYNWHQGNQCFCFWLNSVKKKINQTKALLHLTCLERGRCWGTKAHNSASLQVQKERQNKAKIIWSSECLVFQSVFQDVLETHALAQCLGMNICSVRYDSPMADQWNIGYFACWQQISGCLSFY